MIWVALSFGLVSSLHCTIMCAPLQAVVMGQWLRSGKKANWLLYHSGRIFTYVTLGLGVGIVGTAMGVPTWQAEFTIIAGLLLLLGYFGFKTFQWDRQLYRLITLF
ncbi:MAG: sulfite exporter TauE/SafE family protein [Owenweeksia sp.]|nr:sulfite exporter TauE/SafE family protein [Owenweeksia sp.]